MRIRSRLDQAFMGAFPVPFDDNSKLVIFSDVHRGEDSLSDEFARNRHIYYHALNYYYQSDFTYIEAGDGDEMWENPHFDRIYNAHSQIYELLRKFYAANRLYILYGNHNMQFRNEKFVEENLYTAVDDYAEVEEDLFPGIHVHEALVLKHRHTGQEFFVVHGHQGDLLNDQLWRMSFLIIRTCWRVLHLMGIHYSSSPARNRQKRHRLEKYFQKWNQDTGVSIICGHTHRPKFPSPGDPAYFNSGCCVQPRGIQCLEILYGKICLVSWRMHSRRDGSLFVKRTILKGPEPILHFHSAATECFCTDGE